MLKIYVAISIAIARNFTTVVFITGPDRNIISYVVAAQGVLEIAGPFLRTDALFSVYHVSKERAGRVSRGFLH